MEHGGVGVGEVLPLFVNKTQPGVKSDILAIKTIRFLFALPIVSRECVFLGKDSGRWGWVGREWVWQGAIKDGIKKTKQNKTVQSEE